MKTLRLPARLLGVWLGCLLLAGCETTAPKGPPQKRFQEGAATDLVLRFNSWETIHILRPELRDGAFLRILTRTTVEQQIKTQPRGKNLAVVLIGYLYSLDQQAELAREWDALLLGNGVRRVVILRSGPGKDIDGLPILHDSAIAAGNEKTAVPATNVGLPPATRTNAANPSGH